MELSLLGQLLLAAHASGATRSFALVSQLSSRAEQFSLDDIILTPIFSIDDDLDHEALPTKRPPQCRPYLELFELHKQHDPL